MTDKLTDTEVKKALECCKNILANCPECPMKEKERIMCCDLVKEYALDLINRQEVRIHQQEKTIMEIQNANLIDFKATIGDYIAENESLKAEVEKLITQNSKLEGENFSLRVKSNHYNFLYDEFVNKPTSRIKAEAYKEAFEKVKEELKNIARIDWQGGYYYLIGEAFFDNLLNDLVGDALSFLKKEV